MHDTDTRLSAHLRKLVPSGVVAAAGAIRSDDDKKLSESEADDFRRCVPKVRRASGAARRLARGLLVCQGQHAADIRRGESGEPIWPSGVIGSLTHDDRIAAAAVGIDCRWIGLGIDVEPNESLSDDLAELITTAEELRKARSAGATLRQIFSIKEAVFKATYPTDRVMMNFNDVSVCFRSWSARTSHGRYVNWSSYRGDCILAVAWC